MGKNEPSQAIAGAESLALWLLDKFGELAGYVPSSDVVEDIEADGYSARVYPVVRRHGAVAWLGNPMAVSSRDDVDMAKAFQVGAASRYIALMCVLPNAVIDPMWGHYIDHSGGKLPDENANQAVLDFRDFDRGAEFGDSL